MYFVFVVKTESYFVFASTCGLIAANRKRTAVLGEFACLSMFFPCWALRLNYSVVHFPCGFWMCLLCWQLVACALSCQCVSEYTHLYVCLSSPQTWLRWSAPPCRPAAASGPAHPAPGPQWSDTHIQDRHEISKAGRETQGYCTLCCNYPPVTTNRQAKGYFNLRWI